MMMPARCATGIQLARRASTSRTIILSVQYLIKQYPLDSGALEIQYIEEFFGEFPQRKSAPEIIERLRDREYLILMAEARLPDDPTAIVPVSYKVAHELRRHERDPKLVDLVGRLQDCIEFDGRRVLYSWLGATRRDWRGQGHFRALSEQQEDWALSMGYDEILVKTKNRYYDMRGTLDTLQFDVIKFEPSAIDHGESKVYLSKRLKPETRHAHRSKRAVTIAE